MLTHRLRSSSAWLLGLSLGASMSVGCGSSSGPTETPSADTPETQREPVTPAPNASDPGPAMTAAPVTPPAGAAGSSNRGESEAPVGPVGLAGGSGQAPGSTSGTATPDAGASTPVEEPPPAAAFSPCPSDGTPCRIMPLGDSITFGIGSTGGGYRVDLFRRALADQRDITFVGVVAGSNTPNGPNMVSGQPFPSSHEGFPGFTISGGAAGSLAAQVDNAIDATDPNIVLLMIGTNDVNGNIDLANAPNRLGALLDQITTDAPDALLAVGQLIPITNAQTNTRVQAYNAAIPALVQARAAAGKHVVLVDLFTPFSTNPNAAALMNDALHPNDAGYVVMAQTWYDAIEDLLPPL